MEESSAFAGVVSPRIPRSPVSSLAFGGGLQVEAWIGCIPRLSLDLDRNLAPVV